jgi:NADPH2:quinone reductase
MMKKDQNLGDSIAGAVQLIGSNVVGIAKGSPVAAFHVILALYGAFAEYDVAPIHTVCLISSTASFEEEVTILLAAFTAAIALFNLLVLLAPWNSKARESLDAGKRPLVIYSASSAVGAYTVKLAQAAKINVVIALGSSNSAFVWSFLIESNGDRMLDHKAWNKILLEFIKRFL